MFMCTLYVNAPHPISSRHTNTLLPAKIITHMHAYKLKKKQQKTNKKQTIAEGNWVFLKRRTESRGFILVIRAVRQIA